jgi:hypothetical protein
MAGAFLPAPPPTSPQTATLERAAVDVNPGRVISFGPPAAPGPASLASTTRPFGAFSAWN